jgi:phosphate starvation-inducible PhoH-like protein
MLFMRTRKKQKNISGEIKDTSPKVYQRDKIDFELKIRELEWTNKQREFFKLISDKETRIIFVSGPAGSSKTLIAVRAALQILNDKKASDIICVRAAVESADSKLGYLPGDLQSKYDVYMMPFADKLEELLPVDQIKRLKNDNRITNQPINFCRGLSFAAKVILMDEMQNATLSEFGTLLTRMGKFTKMIVCADPSQSDLPFNKQGAFEKIVELFSCEESRRMGIHHFKFSEDDILRSELCKFVVKKINSHKKEETIKALERAEREKKSGKNQAANISQIHQDSWSPNQKI